MVLNWIENANSILNSNTCIITKSFLVTGLSNALGGHEDHLIRDDTVRIEIEEIMSEVFGEETMGFQAQEETNQDADPFSEASSTASDLSGADQELFSPEFELITDSEDDAQL